MRILMVSNTAWYLFNFRLRLMQALREAGHEVVAAAPPDAWLPRLREAGFEVEELKLSGAGTNPLTELASVRQLTGIFRRRRAELVFSFTPKGNLYSALACIVLRRHFVPNVSGLGRTSIKRSPLTLLVRLLYRLTLRRATHVFFQNDDDLESFVAQGLVTRERSERLPGSGVDLDRFRPRPRAALRAPDAPAFLLVARMMWDKGVGEYVEAARLVRRQHPQAEFRLLGFVDVQNPSAITRAQMAAWEAEGLVRYLGPTDDVAPFLADADCVVLPSYREGLPRTLLEAAAMARPIVTTDAPGCRDTVIDGASGFLCKVADAPDLAAALLRFVALPAEERTAMGRVGRDHVEQRFDERRVLQAYLEQAQRLAAGRR